MHLFVFIKIIKINKISSLFGYRVGIWLEFGQGWKLVKKSKFGKVSAWDSL